MGALIMNDEKLIKDLAFIMNSCGAVPGPPGLPFSSFADKKHYT
jgi:hypothetical protein